MKGLLGWGALALGAVSLLALGAFGLARYKVAQRLDQRFDIAVPLVPIPFPLEPSDAAGLAPEGREAEALARAVARGKRYAQSRAACEDCHAQDFGGKVIIDSPAMGRWVAPNITRAGRTRDYRPEDWVRIVRHGVKPDGRPATMPSRDYAELSDQEVSDLAAYIQSLPPVTRENPPSKLGPVLMLLIASGEFSLDAERIDHRAPRLKYPPEHRADVTLGRHLTALCQGCHGSRYSGGPIAGGDPNWPPAANLTFHATGLAGWELADFRRAMREGVSKSGRKLSPVMPVTYTKNLDDVELEAIYLYLRMLPPTPLGAR